MAVEYGGNEQLIAILLLAFASACVASSRSCHELMIDPTVSADEYYSHCRLLVGPIERRRDESWGQGYGAYFLGATSSSFPSDSMT
jgi:hypothetical protein